MDGIVTRGRVAIGPGDDAVKEAQSSIKTPPFRAGEAFRISGRALRALKIDAAGALAWTGRLSTGCRWLEAVTEVALAQLGVHTALGGTCRATPGLR